MEMVMPLPVDEREMRNPTLEATLESGIKHFLFSGFLCLSFNYRLLTVCTLQLYVFSHICQTKWIWCFDITTKISKIGWCSQDFRREIRYWFSLIFHIQSVPTPYCWAQKEWPKLENPTFFYKISKKQKH